MFRTLPARPVPSATQTHPALHPDVSRQRADDGRTVLVAPDRVAYLNVSLAEEGVLALCDGSRSLAQIIDEATALELPVAPDGTIDLLERLHRAEMLLDPQAAQTSLFGAVAGPRRSRAGVSFAALKFVATPGALVPRAVWRPAFVLVGAATAALLVAAVATGRAHTLLSPFHPGASTAAVLGASYLGASFALSLRALVRAWVLRSNGLDVPGAGAQVTAGIVHVSTDAREVRGARRDVRLVAAQAGLAALAAAALVGGALSWRGGTAITRGLSAAAWLLLVLDTAPYLRTDTRTLLGIATRVRGLGRHALGYVFRGASARGALGRSEAAFAIAGTIAAFHAVALLGILGLHVLPDAVERGVAALFGADLMAAGAVERTLAVATAAASVVVVVALLGVMLSGVLRTGYEVLRPRPTRSPRTPAPATPEDRSVLTSSRALAVLASDVSDTDRERLVVAAQVVGYERGDRLMAAGRDEPWLGIVLSGEATVLSRDVSGVTETVVELGSGDFYGLNALDGGASAFTIVASTPMRVAVITADAARAVSADAAAQLAARLALVRTLRDLPVARGLAASRFAELVDAAEGIELEAGEEREVSRADERSLWVVRDGTIDVVGGDEGLSDAVLNAGDTGGAFAPSNPLATGRRLRARTRARLLRVPFHEVRAALLTGAPAVVDLSRRRMRSTAATAAVDRRSR